MLSYRDVEHLVFYAGEGQYWLEVKSRQQHTLPANMLCGDTFYLKVSKQIMDEKLKLLQQVQENKYPESLKVEKKYGVPEPVMNSQSYKNFEVNKKYSRVQSCSYLSFSFREAHYRELLEFLTILEFNQIRGKEFVSFQSFHKVY